MSKYIQLARCYFDDKDIEDLLSNPRFNQRALLQIAKERGVFLSPDDSREDIVRYLSMQYFDWAAKSSIAARLNKAEAEEKRATVQFEKVATLTAIEKAAEKVKMELPQNRETVSVSKVGDRLVLSGTYIDVDPTRSKAMQREQRQFMVEFAVDKGAVKAEYTHSERAGSLISKIVAELKADEATKDTSVRRVSMSGIKDPALRTDFLLKVRTGLAGFRPLDVHDVNVDHRFEVAPDENEDEDENDGGSTTAEEEEVKSLVRSAALHGNGLLTCELYQKLRESGYYIYRLAWSARELEGDGRAMDFEAGFDDPVRGEGFAYDLKRVLPTESDKEAGKTQHELLLSERPRVRRIIADAVYTALAEIENRANEKESSQ